MDQINSYEDRQPAESKHSRVWPGPDSGTNVFWMEVRDTFTAGQSMRIGEMTITMKGINPVGMTIAPLEFLKF